LAPCEPLAVANIGGVANLTWIPARNSAGELLGFDTGPGNGMIDDWVRARLGLAMDRDGAVAKSGAVDEAALTKLLAHPYFDAPAPKSLDRFAFDVGVLQGASTADGAATLTAFTAATIARGLALCPELPARLLVTGGGRHNTVLMAALRERSHLPVDAVETVGWQGDVLEAQAFGYLAVRCLKQLPITFPGTTGVARPLTGGRIAHP
jgi:anhydro-N-acetylmuramic acid kinase